MTEKLGLSIHAETEIKRFLHYGAIVGVFTPLGNPPPVPMYDMENMLPFGEVLKNDQAAGEIIALIKRVIADGFSAKPSAILFALAYIIKIGPEKIKHNAYSVVPLLTKTSKDFILFNVYVTYHQKMLNINTGFGAGWTKAVKKWYADKTLMQFTDLLTSRGLQHWNHLKLLNRGHIKFDKTEKQLIYEALRSKDPDFDSLVDIDKELTAAANHAKQVLMVQNLTKDPAEAEALALKHNIDIEQCPFVILRSVKIWLREISLMSAEDVILNLHRLGKFRLSKDREIVGALKDKLDVQELNIHPSFIFLRLKEMERAPIRTFMLKHGTVGNPRKRSLAEAFCSGPKLKLTDLHLSDFKDNKLYEVLDPKQRAVLRYYQTKPIRRSHDVLARRLMNLCFTTMKGLAATGLKYLIVVDTSLILSAKSCEGNKYVSVQEAMLLILLCILSAEPDGSVDVVTVVDVSKDVAGTEGFINRIVVDKEDTFATLAVKFKAMNDVKSPEAQLRSLYNLDRVLEWMLNDRVCYDAVISLGGNDFLSTDMDLILNQYRSEVNWDTRLVICSLNGQPKATLNFSEAIFLITGFNENVCQLIEAFCRKAF